MLCVRAYLGDAKVEVSLDVAGGYSPDVLDDLNARVGQLMEDLARIAAEYGTPTMGAMEQAHEAYARNRVARDEASARRRAGRSGGFPDPGGSTA